MVWGGGGGNTGGAAEGGARGTRCGHREPYGPRRSREDTKPKSGRFFTLEQRCFALPRRAARVRPLRGTHVSRGSTWGPVCSPRRVESCCVGFLLPWGRRVTRKPRLHPATVSVSDACGRALLGGPAARSAWEPLSESGGMLAGAASPEGRRGVGSASEGAQLLPAGASRGCLSVLATRPLGPPGRLGGLPSVARLTVPLVSSVPLLTLLGAPSAWAEPRASASGGRGAQGSWALLASLASTPSSSVIAVCQVEMHVPWSWTWSP